MNDDLDEDMLDSEGGFDEFSSNSSGVGGQLRQNLAVKIGVVVLVLAVLVGAALFFGRDEAVETQSVVLPGSDVTSVPGADDKVSPAYLEAVEEQNEAELERAISSGDSAIPVPIETSDALLDVPDRAEADQDPLHRWRMLQAEKAVREMRIRESAPEPITVVDSEKQSEETKALTESMLQQMESILSVTTEDKNFTTKTLISYDDEIGSATSAGGAADDADTGGGASSFTEDDEEVVIIPAGKIVYGQMLLEANSDVPSVILAQMVSGPLRGWKLLGRFETLDDINLLGISFDTAVNEEGDQYSVSAIMLDPDTGLAAMSTDVDHRYFRRVVLPAAAAFVQGFSSAIAESGRTTITVKGETVVDEQNDTNNDQEVASGIQQAGKEIANILDEEADVEVKVVIEAGTPIGVFFSENVVETEEDI